MEYWPNPAHKRETTEAGPPQWRPTKSLCPDDMTVEERDALLKTAVPLHPDDSSSRRFNVRRLPDGSLQLFDAKCHDVQLPAFHAHPATFVPARVLRAFRDNGLITVPEYRRLVREFGQP